MYFFFVFLLMLFSLKHVYGNNEKSKIITYLENKLNDMNEKISDDEESKKSDDEN
jgi:hypothetical protein